MGDIFAAIKQPKNPNLLVGFESSDDSAVYRLDEKTGLVQSIDFFTPIVDDPRTFGAIAAANALSDIYAMGGQPLTALSMVCFPYTQLDTRILAEITAGGADKIVESGAMVVGGHSVSDDEVKFGYAITGLVSPDQIWRNDTPHVGDALVLSKPLGTGLITTAVKQDKLEPGFLDEPIMEMARLNRAARDAARSLDVHAVTDITGFGLMGHLFEMLKTQSLGAIINTEALATFEGVFSAIEAKALTRAHRTNREYVADYDVTENAALAKYGDIIFDPQTSGGLLFSLPKSEAQQLLDALVAAGHRPSLVGEVTSSPVIQCR